MEPTNIYRSQSVRPITSESVEDNQKVFTSSINDLPEKASIIKKGDFSLTHHPLTHSTDAKVSKVATLIAVAKHKL